MTIDQAIEELKGEDYKIIQLVLKKNPILKSPISSDTRASRRYSIKEPRSNDTTEGWYPETGIFIKGRFPNVRNTDFHLYGIVISSIWVHDGKYCGIFRKIREGSGCCFKMFKVAI